MIGEDCTRSILFRLTVNVEFLITMRNSFFDK